MTAHIDVAFPTRRRVLSLLGLATVSLAACAAGGAGATDVATPAADDVVVVDPMDVGTAGSPIAAAFAEGLIASVRLIGDSITDGYGCEGFGEHTDRIVYQGGEGVYHESAATFASWANDFRAYAATKGVLGAAFVNAGVSGARMAWLADEPDAWLADADLIAVMLGTNDAVWSTPAEYASDAEAALAAAAGRCAQLVVISPPENYRTDGRAQFSMAEADAILGRICGEAGYVHVSALAAVAADDGTLNADGIHPTTAGSHAIWAAVSSGLGL